MAFFCFFQKRILWSVAFSDPPIFSERFKTLRRRFGGHLQWWSADLNRSSSKGSKKGGMFGCRLLDGSQLGSMVINDQWVVITYNLLVIKGGNIIGGEITHWSDHLLIHPNFRPKGTSKVFRDRVLGWRGSFFCRTELWFIKPKFGVWKDFRSEFGTESRLPCILNRENIMRVAQTLWTISG